MASKSVLSHGYQLPWDQFKFFMYKAKAEQYFLMANCMPTTASWDDNKNNNYNNGKILYSPDFVSSTIPNAFLRHTPF